MPRINGENYSYLPRLKVDKLIGGAVGNLPVAITERLPSELTGLTPMVKAGKYDSSVKPTDLIDVSSFTDTVYVNINRTDDTGSGNQWSTAKKYLSSAITAANAKAGPTRIFVMAGVYPKFAAFGSANAAVLPNKKISIEAVYGRAICGAFDALTWAKTGGQTNVYEAARSAAQTAYNPLIVDQNGDYIPYTYQTSIANVDANPGSWYTDNVTVYLHAHDSTPVNNLNSRVYYDNFGAFITTTNDLYIAGFDF